MTSSRPRTSLRQNSPSASTAPANSGSQTITQPTTHNNTNPTLRLRAQDNTAPTQDTTPSTRNRRRIRWDESVIDNEGMGKKSSKVCCIYHAPHEPGDSESDSDSSSSDDSDGGEPDLSRAQRAGGAKARKGRKGNGDEDGGGGDGGDGGEGGGGGGSGEGKGKQRKASPNAYERQPKAKVKGKKEG